MMLVWLMSTDITCDQIDIHHPMTGWYTCPSETYEFVSWDDEIPNMMGKIKFMFQITNQMNSSQNHFSLGDMAVCQNLVPLLFTSK